METFLGLKGVPVGHFRALKVLFRRIVLDVGVCVVLGWRSEVSAAFTSEIGARVLRLHVNDGPHVPHAKVDMRRLRCYHVRGRFLLF